MKILNKDRITSLELLEQINLFRVKEGRRKTTHKDLLKIIREEFFEEIGVGKISPTSKVDDNKIDVQKILEISKVDDNKIYETTYKDQWNRKQPMYNLTYNQAKQVLARESKTVRKAVFKYIEHLEKKYITAIKILNNKNSPEWLEIRQGSKENNKSFRDTLKSLESYAIARGSTKANLIYRNYTKLINKLSGTDDTRDSLTPYKLHLIEQLENILKKEINKGMTELKDYKAIYKNCKMKGNEFINFLN
nr:hypothetical protein [Fusobacterium gastrosuis]